MSYSKITKKGQTTIPIKYREKYGMKEGTNIAFEETDKGLLLKPVHDIAESAGALSDYADPKEILSDIVRAREEEFR